MNYVGGKARIAEWVAEFVLRLGSGCHTYLEPFVGSGATFVRHSPYFARAIAADGHPDLILMWKALAEGWMPPESLTQDEYKELRHAEPSAIRALAGFGASFRGKWFGGFDGREGLTSRSRTPMRPSFVISREATVKKAPFFARGEIVHGDYKVHAPTRGWLVYCDPPYAGTHKYTGAIPFDSAEFWEVARGWADAGAIVVVSESEAPAGWVVVAERERKAVLRVAKDGENERRRECLFMLAEQVPVWMR